MDENTRGQWEKPGNIGTKHMGNGKKWTWEMENVMWCEGWFVFSESWGRSAIVAIVKLERLINFASVWGPHFLQDFCLVFWIWHYLTQKPSSRMFWCQLGMVVEGDYTISYTPSEAISWILGHVFFQLSQEKNGAPPVIESVFMAWFFAWNQPLSMFILDTSGWKPHESPMIFRSGDRAIHPLESGGLI